MKFSTSIFITILARLAVKSTEAFTLGLVSPLRNLPTGVTTLHESKPEAVDSAEAKKDKKNLKPIILDPFLEAADPKYATTAAVGEDNFIVSRSGGPTDEELTDENLYKIISREATDLDVNTLVWKCLGYRFDFEKKEWAPEEAFPKWKERFPTPPDFIGMQRIYSKEVDGPCLRNNQALVRTIPHDNKKSYLKEYMKPFGFTGYQVSRVDWTQ